jgi:SpoVK/Ycf46/Vps4 family AAA+-type ATPase
VGHAAANVRDIFAKARAASPAILFIDELDLVAPIRKGGVNDVLVQEIISQTLQEMDGIVDQHRQVFVLAATNLPENVACECSRFSLSKRRSIPCSLATTLCSVNCRRVCHSAIFVIGWLSHSARP